MPTQPPIEPTDAELGILNVLWDRGASTVRKIHEVLGTRTGYTTTLKLLQNMNEKGLVVRNESQRAHVYRARHLRMGTQLQLLTRLLNRGFGGSTSQLVMQALAAKRATAEELKEIKKLVDRLAKESK